MNTFLCILVWIALALLVPVLILGWATGPKSEQIRRLNAAGWSQARIAAHMDITRYQVRKALKA